jgi:hypothetical protein
MNETDCFTGMPPCVDHEMPRSLSTILINGQHMTWRELEATTIFVIGRNAVDEFSGKILKE